MILIEIMKTADDLCIQACHYMVYHNSVTDWFGQRICLKDDLKGVP